jgi:4-hydroxythreonine-4-phosphate dehydrogenase
MKTIFITPGDPAGIGPEIVSKALKRKKFSPASTGHRLVCVGAIAPFLRMDVPVAEITDEDLAKKRFPKRGIPFLAAPSAIPAGVPGSLLEGFQAGWSIEKATHLIQQGYGHALVTGPISKERLQAGGFRFTGHTDFLAHLCGVPEVTMMLANDQLRVSLVTVHIGLQQVSKSLTREKLRRAIIQTADGLKQYWRIRKPRIAVAALNPHAGEGGLFGREEIETISPEIEALRQQGYSLEGPLPADTLFANQRIKPRYDAVVCMYHDQGLIPVKLLDFSKTVNVTLGLPIVRTSVDHGVAFDIAGKNIADPSSLESAIELALEVKPK